MAADLSIPWLRLLAPLFLFIFGIFWIGIARRRIGLTPHCGKCDYVLLGIGSAVCPECGQELTAVNIVRGERTRRRTFWFGVCGILASLVLAGVIVTPVVRNYDWYRVRPLSWVMQDAGSRENLRANRAWDELVRRRSVGRLSEGDEQQIIELALKEQAAAQNNHTRGPILRQLLKYLGARALAEKLTDAQKTQFLENAIRYRLRVRPIVGAGAPYVIEWSGSDCGPDEGFWTEVISQSLDVGSQHLEESSGSGTLGFRLGSEGHYLTAPPPGDYPVTLAVKLRVSEVDVPVRLSGGDIPKGKLLHEWKIRTRATLAVVDEVPADDIKLLDKPEVQAQMQAAIRVPGWNSQRQGFSMRVLITAPPENIGFEVFARGGGKEYRIGDVALQKGKTMYYSLDPGPLPEPLKESIKFDVILRSSERVGRQTVDLHDIWKGEVIIKDVPFLPR